MPQDLTQAFFSTLLGKGMLEVADRQRGKFRSFLLAALNHFVANQQREARAHKRGGGHTTTSLDDVDFVDAERRYARELAHTTTPERLFERRWALTVLEQAFAKLAREYTSSGKAALFAELEPFLGGGPDDVSYRVIASRLDMTEGAVKVAVHRLRRRCRAILRSEIAQTVADPEDVDEELRHWRTLLVS